MRITKLEIKNFGPIEYLDAPLNNASVVGLVGPNGMGKTHVITALTLAFTGSKALPNAAESYIRHFGLNEGSPKSASVLVEFVKNGEKFTIFRQIGSGSKSRMEWEGLKKPLTSVKDIETKIYEVLGADRDSIANAIFVAQGEMDKLVAGKDRAAKEEVMMKLMGISYLSARADVMLDEINKLREQIVDYAPAMDVAKANASKSQSDLVEANETLKGMSDPTALLEAMTSVQKSSQLQERVQEEIAEVGASVRESEGRLSEIVSAAECPAGLSYDEISYFIGNKEGAMSREGTALTELKGRLDAERQNAAAYKSVTDELESVVQQVSVLKKPEGDPVDAIVLQNLNALRHDIQEFENISALRKASAEQYAEAIKSCELSQKEMEEVKATNAPKIADSRTLLESIRKSAGLLFQKIEMTVAVHSHHAEDSDKCPLCGSDMVQVLKDAVESLPQMKEELRELNDTIKEKESLISTLQIAMYDKAQTFRNRETDKSEKWEAVQKSITDLNGFLQLHPGIDTSLSSKTIGEEIATYSAVLNLWNDYNAKLGNLTNRETYLKERLNSMTPPTRSIADIDAEILTVQTSMRTVEATLTNFRNSVSYPYHQWISRKNDLIIKSESLKKENDTIEESLSESNARIPELAGQDVRLNEALFLRKSQGFQAATKYLQDIANARNAQLGVIHALNDTYKDAMDRISEITRKMEQDQIDRDIIAELTRVRDMFLRTNLPTVYMQYRFEKIAAITQEQLMELDANFSVMPDPDRPVSFLFQRTDDDTGYVMKQTQLSGGQKIRLSVALLMALQKVLLPEVGFLVLDEPSVHVDREGVESLADLLSSLGENLQASDAQLFVCDHVPELMRAFQEVIHLGK